MYGYNAIFVWTYTGALLLCVLLWAIPMSATPSSPMLRAKERSKRTGQSSMQLLQKLWRIVVVATMYGCAMTLCEHIMFLQLDRQFRVSKVFVGYVTIVGTATELPVFWFSQRLIQRFGHQRLLLFSHAMMILRLLLLSQLGDGYQHTVFFIQALHGFCFALFWSAMVDATFKLAPVHLKGTSQSLLSTAYYVVGPAVGSPGWGALYQWTGRAAPAYFGGVMLVGASMVGVSHLRLDHVIREQSDGHDDDEIRLVNV
eukprot:TRINITY_DN26441_c0_g2_i3.p1 TRINITY_DN26441_c0_g2~~TRINITY_DN26441_c0_g2_i3.p1  ORF type:complete len:257 (+),score=56.16 TRINITY_DN26441_c0_g2_i3:1-771(+)